MRRTRYGSRRRPAPRPGGLLLALTLAALAGSASTAPAQATKGKPNLPDTRPLARYIPRDNLVAFVGTDGLAAQGDAWKKTAAYKMLNDTTLGVMLEEVAAQLADRLMASLPNRKATGAELVTVLRLAAMRGFAFGFNVDPKGEAGAHATLVFRGAAARENRQVFSRFLGTLMGASPAKTAKRGGRTVALAVNGPGGGWAWWAEGNDVVLALGGPADGETAMAALDGKRPSAADHPVRAELLKADGGFQPVGCLFVDPTAYPPHPGAAAYETLQKLKNEYGLARFDYRWGFQDDALMTVTRFKAPKPRKGLLAMFDQPSFEKGKLPPLPEGSESFTVLSADPAGLLDQFLAMAPTPQAKASVTQALDAMKTKSRIDVRKDLLAHMGPTMAVYVAAPTHTAGEAPAGKEAGAAAGPLAAIPGLNPVAALGLAAGPFPKITLVADIDDPEAFGKSLDNLMVAVNRQLKDQANEAAEKAQAEAAKAKTKDAPDAPPGRGRRRAPAPAPEFRPMPGKDKVYVLSFPAGLARKPPVGFRPTVRVGPKHVALASTPEAARQALEVKAGAWVPPADLTAAFENLPAAMVFLNVSDPRDATPEALATLPASLQRGFNTAIAMRNAPPPGAPGAPGATPTPGAPAMAGMPGMPGGMPGMPGMPGGGGNSGQEAMQRMMASGMPGAGGSSSGGASRPSMGSPPGGGGGAPASADADPKTAMLEFKIDPSKLPKPDELRSRLFPGAFAVAADGDEVRVVTRSAFPSLGTVAAGGATTAVLIPAFQAGRNAARAAAARNAAAAGTAAPDGSPAAGPSPGGSPPPRSSSPGASSSPPRSSPSGGAPSSKGSSAPR